LGGALAYYSRRTAVAASVDGVAIDERQRLAARAMLSNAEGLVRSMHAMNARYVVVCAPSAYDLDGLCQIAESAASPDTFATLELLEGLASYYPPAPPPGLECVYVSPEHWQCETPSGFSSAPVFAVFGLASEDRSDAPAGVRAR
jgi:hypothetical protein